MTKLLYQDQVLYSNTTSPEIDSSSISDARSTFILALVTLLAMVLVVPLVDKLVLPWLLERRLHIARRRLRALQNDLEATVASEVNPARDFAHKNRLSTSEPPPGSHVTDYELPQIPPLVHFDSILETMPPQAIPVTHLPRATIPNNDWKTAFAEPAAPAYAPSTSSGQVPKGAPAGHASGTHP